MVRVADRSIWSDELEVLVKIRADLLCWMTKKEVNWKKLLPERFIDGATVANVPDAVTLKKVTRGLSRMFDGLVARWKGSKNGKLHS